jgi:hypothetical protein
VVAVAGQGDQSVPIDTVGAGIDRIKVASEMPARFIESAAGERLFCRLPHRGSGAHVTSGTNAIG